MSRYRFIVNMKTIARNALPKSAGFHGDTFAGKVANGYYDFNAMQPELMKRVSGKSLYTTGCDSLTLP
jgi:hypothetical protein